MKEFEFTDLNEGEVIVSSKTTLMCNFSQLRCRIYLNSDQNSQLNLQLFSDQNKQSN